MAYEVTERTAILRAVADTEMAELVAATYATPAMVARVEKNLNLIIDDYVDGYTTFDEALKQIIDEW